MSQSTEEMIREWFRESVRIKEEFVSANIPVIKRAARVIADSLNNGNKIVLFGNGGSAADAQHIACEFVNRFMMERPPLPAIALTTDTSILTSISNDIDFSDVFSRQLKALGEKGDVAIGISTSGKSTNVVKALQVAKDMEIFSIGLTGGDGGEVALVADICMIVPSDSTPHIQEVHITIGHLLCHLVDAYLFQLVE